MSVESKLIVLRHGEKDRRTLNLTETGQAMARERGNQLGDFDVVFSTSKPRGRETARFMTGREPWIDERAGVIAFTPEQELRRTEVSERHPFGSAGILEDPELSPLVVTSGYLLIHLLEEALWEVRPGEQGLVVSHDLTMIAAEKLLQGSNPTVVDKRYGYLHGFQIDNSFQPQGIVFSQSAQLLSR